MRLTTHLVEITLVAGDKAGGSSGDLHSADVRVWDNGKEQTIATFEKLSSRAAGDSKLPPGTFSNRTGRRAQVLSVVLLDALNTRWSDGAYARAEVVRTLAQIRPDERVAVFVLGDGLRVLHDFSSDAASLSSKLQKPPAARGEDSPTDWPFSAAFSYGSLFHPRMETGAAAAFSRTHRILDTFAALEAIAGYVKGIPGRKNLLWVSAGFPLAIGTPDTGGGADMSQLRTFGGEMDRAVRALNGANIAVYPIDARGLTVGNPYINVSTMQDLARQTGGIAFYNRNDLHQAARTALDDSREVYLLSYSPRPFAEDGTFHRIRIQTARRGVSLRYRQGYYAAGAAPREQPGDQSRLIAALASPLDASEIGITARVEGDAVVFHIDPADLDLDRNGDHWSGGAGVGLEQVGAGGERYGRVIDEIKLDLTPETYQRAMQGDVGFRMHWNRDARASVLRMAVLARKRGRVGSLSLPLGSR